MKSFNNVAPGYRRNLGPFKNLQPQRPRTTFKYLIGIVLKVVNTSCSIKKKIQSQDMILCKSQLEENFTNKINIHSK